MKNWCLYYLCSCFQSMSMVCLHIYLNILWFLSSTLCSFQHTSPVHVLLDWHLHSLLLAGYKRYCSLNFSAHMFIAGIQEHNLFFNDYFGSWNLSNSVMILNSLVLFFVDSLEISMYTTNVIIFKSGLFYFSLSKRCAFYCLLLPLHEIELSVVCWFPAQFHWDWRTHSELFQFF